MKAASLKHFLALTNIRLKRKDWTVKDHDHNVSYMDPAHVMMVGIEHHEPKDEEQYAYIGMDRVDRLTPIPDIEGEQVIVNVDYVRDFVDHLAHGTYIIIKVKTDYPIYIHGMLDCETEASAYIAPFIRRKDES